MSKQFSKDDLKKFICDAIWVELPENSRVDRPALVNVINSRVDIFCEPYEQWLICDGELDSIITLIGDGMDA